MKEVTLLSRRRLDTAPKAIRKNIGRKTVIRYMKPKYSNDLKRWGRSMVVNNGEQQIILDGRAINAIKSVLKKSGEIHY
jgi:hypothetical protein